MKSSLRITVITLILACFSTTTAFGGAGTPMPTASRGPHIRIGSPQFFGGSDFVGLMAYTNPRSELSDRALYSGVLFIGRWSFGAVVQPQQAHFHLGPYHFFNVKVTAATIEMGAVFLLLAMFASLSCMLRIRRHTS